MQAEGLAVNREAFDALVDVVARLGLAAYERGELDLEQPDPPPDLPDERAAA